MYTFYLYAAAFHPLPQIYRWSTDPLFSSPFQFYLKECHSSHHVLTKEELKELNNNNKESTIFTSMVSFSLNGAML